MVMRTKSGFTSRGRASAVGVVLLALMLAACGGAADEPDAAPEPDAAEAPDAEAPEAEPEPPGELQQVTFALTNQRAIQYHPYYLADYLGYWEEEGLDVTIEIVSGSSAAVQQLIAGNVDIAHPSGPATAQGVGQGHCLRQIYSFDHVNVFGLGGDTAQGITSLEDLRGGIVGVSEPGGGEIPLLRTVLTEAGLEEDVDYQFLPIGEGGALTANALLQGQAQAYGSSNYDIASLASEVELVPLMPDKYRFLPSTSVVVRCETFEADKEMLTGFARAVAKATEFSLANPDAAWDIAETYEPTLFEDEEIARAFWDAATAAMMLPPAIEGSPWGSHNYEGWQTYLDGAVQGTEEEGGLPEEAVDIILNEMLTEELIPAINDFDVEAVREEARNFPGVM
jgi:NitT/TauT family transport system substrate-binding protein